MEVFGSAPDRTAGDAELTGGSEFEDEWFGGDWLCVAS